MNKYVVGDIHGNYKALLQVLECSNFDYENDLLICLGDVADGFSEVPECIELLMKIKYLVWCLGNHDEWLRNWMSGKMNMEGVSIDGHYNPTFTKREAHLWLSQGGKATFKAYIQKPELLAKHRSFWINKPV